MSLVGWGKTFFIISIVISAVNPRKRRLWRIMKIILVTSTLRSRRLVSCFLFQSEEQGEITIIQNSIITLIWRDTKGAIIGIFSQIHTWEEVVRDGRG